MVICNCFTRLLSYIANTERQRDRETERERAREIVREREGARH